MKAKTPQFLQPNVTAPAQDQRGNGVDPLDWINQRGAESDILRAMDRQLRRRRRRRLSALTAAVVVLLGGFVWQAKWRGIDARASHSAAVVRVPPRQILPDGSVIELKEGASVLLAFTDAVRRVELLRGEAHFEIAKNQSRPFIVAIDHVEIRAVGTSFSIQRGQTQVAVLVTEGRVVVDKLNAPLGHLPSVPKGSAATHQTITTLDAGNLAMVDLAVSATPAIAQVQSLPITEMNERLAWRVPRLEFSGTPLGDAIPIINRHSRIKLVLDDPTLSEVKISGVLRADNIDTLRELLAETHRIMSEYRNETEIVLSRAR
ncbi:MAG: FecR domain-containing protein [Opitutaceae bacterium]|nr:FecR domain-containing protein [Opitutaceae bacterium]